MAKPTGTPPVEQQPQQQNQAPSQVARYLAADAPPVPLRYLTYLFEHVAGVIFFLEVLDGDRYRFSAVNERFTLATGLPVGAVIGKEVDEIIPPDSLALVKSKYREAIATRNVVRWQEVSAYPTGTRTGDVTVSPVIDADGGCRLLMGVVHDITEHVQNRHQLELGSLVFQNSHEAINPPSPPCAATRWRRLPARRRASTTPGWTKPISTMPCGAGCAPAGTGRANYETISAPAIRRCPT